MPDIISLAEQFRGLNRSVSPALLNPKESPDTTDARLTDKTMGKLGPRLGRSRAKVCTYPLLGMGLLLKPDGTRIRILCDTHGDWNTDVLPWPTNDITEGRVVTDVVFDTGEVDLTATATFTVPLHDTFYIDSIELVITECGGTVTTPLVFNTGITGSTAKYLSGAAPSVLTAANKRQMWTTLLADDGETSALKFVITTAGIVSAGNYKGIFYAKGTAVR